ncbi:MAG: TIGR02281 family clan AA aspartic protease [Burkholderiaceae bacterium]|nr:TIGR02281 family clan AA aspartic protease [Burkholderiaceae bacterium]
MNFHLRHVFWLAVLLCAAGAAGAAQSVTLQGTLGSKALLIVDNAPPQVVSPGESVGAVKLISASGEQAVVEIGGARHTLRVGEAPVNVGGALTSGGDTVVLTADTRGHFITQGSINNRPAQFMVDTGASLVALDAGEAARLGLDYQKGQKVLMSTANGVTAGYVIELEQIRIGDVTVYGVRAIVTPTSMPMILLGNSFLNRFNMRRDSDQMTLQRR